MTTKNPINYPLDPSEYEAILKAEKSGGLGHFLRQDTGDNPNAVFVRAQELPVHTTGRDIPSITGIKPIYVDEREFFDE